MPPPPRYVHLMLVAAQLGFASLAVVGRVALADVPANAVVLTRVAGGALVFFALARRGGPVRVAPADRPRLVLCALLGVVVNQLLFVNGLDRTTAVNASILSTTIPVFTAGFAVAAGLERWRASRFAGIGLALGGALLLVGAERLSAGGGHATGNAMIVANCVSYALFLVLVRPLADRYRPMVLVALLFGAALPVVAPFGLVAWARFAPELAGRHVALLAFIVAVPTVGAYALVQLALERADASLAAAYIYLQPVFATAGAVALLGERPGARAAAAAAMVFAGVYVSTRTQGSA